MAEIAAEVLAHNPRLSAAEAMTLSLKTLRLWPRVVLSAERRVLPPLNGDDKPSYDHLTDDHGLDESKLNMGGTRYTHSFEHENYDPEYFNHEHTAGLSRAAMGGADYLPEGEEVRRRVPPVPPGGVQPPGEPLPPLRVLGCRSGASHRDHMSQYQSPDVVRIMERQLVYLEMPKVAFKPPAGKMVCTYCGAENPDSESICSGTAHPALLGLWV